MPYLANIRYYTTHNKVLYKLRENQYSNKHVQLRMKINSAIDCFNLKSNIVILSYRWHFWRTNQAWWAAGGMILGWGNNFQIQWHTFHFVVPSRKSVPNSIWQSKILLLLFYVFTLHPHLTTAATPISKLKSRDGQRCTFSRRKVTFGTQNHYL